MKNFFLATGLILFGSFLIGCFYYVLNSYRGKNQKKIFETVKKKIKTDEKEYLRNYLKHHIPRLKENKIQWIMIQTKPDHSNKIEITYNNLTNEIQVIKNDFKLDNSQKLKKFGINNVVKSSDSYILKIAPNAKIIVDVIYYLFETSDVKNKFTGYKLVTSTNYS